MSPPTNTPICTAGTGVGSVARADLAIDSNSARHSRRQSAARNPRVPFGKPKKNLNQEYVETAVRVDLHGPYFALYPRPGNTYRPLFSGNGGAYHHLPPTTSVPSQLGPLQR